MQLIHGDCLVEMNKIPDHSVDMILCDLPYGTTACKWDVIIPFEPLWQHYWRVLKPTGAVVLFGSEPFSSYLRMSQIKYFKYDWIWDKNKASNIMLAYKQPLKTHEIISVFYKNQCIYTPQKTEGIPYKQRGGHNKNRDDGAITPKNGVKYSDKHDPSKRLPTTIQKFTNHREKKECFHPTQKPVALLEYLIKTYTNEGETVLDNCMGGGSTGIACLNTNRNFIGIEKDDKYFEVAKNRIEGN